LRCIPDRAGGLGVGLMAGQADIVQHVLIQRQQRAALTVQGEGGPNARQKPGAGGVGGQSDVHFQVPYQF